MFDSGRAYPAPPGSLSSHKLADFMENYKEGSCQHCGQTVKPPQSEVGLYLEYAKNEISGAQAYKDAYNYMQDNHNDTWVHMNLIQPYFGPKIGRKVIGERVLFWIIVPAVLNGLVVFYLTAQCICSCICGGGRSKDNSEIKKNSTIKPQKEEPSTPSEPST